MEPENQNNQEEEEQNQEVLDDDYLVQLHQYLIQMKEERKKAEQDANLLDGRIRMLKQEEDKKLKQIEVTRKKTREKKIIITTIRR